MRVEGLRQQRYNAGALLRHIHQHKAQAHDGAAPHVVAHIADSKVQQPLDGSVVVGGPVCVGGGGKTQLLPPQNARLQHQPASTGCQAE
jgi:hypothetical protein